MSCSKLANSTILILTVVPFLLAFSGCDRGYYDEGPDWYGQGYVGYNDYYRYHDDKNHQWARDRNTWDHRNDHQRTPPSNGGHWDGGRPGGGNVGHSNDGPHRGESGNHAGPASGGGGHPTSGGESHESGRGGAGPSGGHGGGESHK